MRASKGFALTPSPWSKRDLGHTESAIQAYQNAISLAPEHISAWNNLGNLYRKLERNDDALVAFQKAVEQNASDAVGWFGLGDLQHALGREDDAIYAFLKAIEFSANYASAWSGLGSCYMVKGLLEQALAAHLKAIEIDAFAWIPGLPWRSLHTAGEKRRSQPGLSHRAGVGSPEYAGP